MTNATPLTPRSTAPKTLALDLAADMLGLLATGVNSPVEQIIRERLLDQNGALAQQLHRELINGEPEDTRRTAVIVSSYVRHILWDAIEEARDQMFQRPW